MPDPQRIPGSYENYLSQHLYNANAEKTFVDKVLNRKDSERLQNLMKKEDLTRTDLLEILYIISGTNVKLVNYNDWDRYLLGKDFAWIRDFATLCESVIEWETAINKEMEEITKDKKTGLGKKDKPEWMEEIIKEVEGSSKTDNEDKNKRIEDLKSKLEILDLIVKIKNVDLHNFKFLVDVYLNLSNSTLSLTGVGFDTLTKSRFEYFYPMEQGQGTKPAPGSSLMVRK